MSAVLLLLHPVPVLRLLRQARAAPRAGAQPPPRQRHPGAAAEERPLRTTARLQINLRQSKRAKIKLVYNFHLIFNRDTNLHAVSNKLNLFVQTYIVKNLDLSSPILKFLLT